MARRQRQGQRLDADAAAGGQDLPAPQMQRRLVEVEPHRKIGQRGDRLHPVGGQALVRRRDQRRQTGELDPALQALDLARRAGEVQVRHGQHARTGRALGGPVEAPLEGGRAFDRRLHIVGDQGAEVGRLQAVFGEGQAGRGNHRPARFGAAVVAQVDAADGVVQTRQLQAGGPDVLGQPRLAPGPQRQEAGRVADVGNLSLIDAGAHRQPLGCAVDRQGALGVGKAHRQEGRGRGDVGQASARAPGAAVRRDERLAGRAEAAGHGLDRILAQVQPAHRQGDAAAGPIGQASVGGGQVALRAEGDVARRAEVERRLALQARREAAGRQPPPHAVEPGLRQTAAARGRQAEGAVRFLSGR
ncbi:hypothetical protein D3C77_357310 [compost metagenome]